MKIEKNKTVSVAEYLSGLAVIVSKFVPEGKIMLNPKDFIKLKENLKKSN